jgi:hypothetical protein
LVSLEAQELIPGGVVLQQSRGGLLGHDGCSRIALPFLDQEV